MEYVQHQVLRKGCNGQNDVTVILCSSELSKEEREQIVKENKQKEIAFLFPSDTADFRAIFYMHKKEQDLCFLGLTATLQTLLQQYPSYKDYSKITIETNVGPFEMDLVTKEFSLKDYQLYGKIKTAVNSEQTPYWTNDVPHLNEYPKECFLLDVPEPSLVLSEPNTEHYFLKSTLVRREDIDESFANLFSIFDQLKYRLQVKWHTHQAEAIFVTLYIQNLATGSMLRLDSLSLEA